MPNRLVFDIAEAAGDSAEPRNFITAFAAILKMSCQYFPALGTYFIRGKTAELSIIGVGRVVWSCHDAVDRACRRPMAHGIVMYGDDATCKTHLGRATFGKMGVGGNDPLVDCKFEGIICKSAYSLLPLQAVGNVALRDRAFPDHLPDRLGDVDRGSAGARADTCVQDQIHAAVHLAENLDTRSASWLA